MDQPPTPLPAAAGTTPLDTTIASICKRVEVLVPGCRTGVCIASPDRSKLARSIFPNLPRTFHATINDLPMGAPYIGCCTAAMDGNAVITVRDLALASRFSEWFVLTCLDHGIQIAAVAPGVRPRAPADRHVRHGIRRAQRVAALRRPIPGIRRRRGRGPSCKGSSTPGRRPASRPDAAPPRIALPAQSGRSMKTSQSRTAGSSG